MGAVNAPKVRTADRVESFVAAIDAYEPLKLAQHEDAFRIFARFISRHIDGRYLERHPPPELLPEIEQMMAATLVREPDEIKVRLRITDEGARRGVLVSCMPDQPFLYSTVRQALEHLGAKVFRTVSSVVPVKRSTSGEMSAVGATDGVRESFVWAELELEDIGRRKADVEKLVRERLDGCRAAVADFASIRKVVTGAADRMLAMAKERPDHRQAYEDAGRLLQWLLDEHFVFLGTRFLPAGEGKPSHAVGDYGTGRISTAYGLVIEDVERAVLDAGGIPPFLWIKKSQTESWLYRPGRLDHVLVQTWDKEGRPAGLVVVEGLFNFQALAEPRTDVPLLEQVAAELYVQLGAQKGSHRYRTVRNAFNSLPLEYLFTLQLDDVRALVQQILEVDVEQRLQLHVTGDELQKFAFVFVALPRSHYSDDLRSDLKKHMLGAFRASSVDDGVYAGDSETVAIHYFLTGAKQLDEGSQAQLKADVELLASPWSDRLFDELNKRVGPKQARHLHNLYAEAFPTRYQEETSIARAVTDIEILEDVAPQSRFECDLYREKIDQQLGVTRLRLFETQGITLSRIMPILDNLGLIVIDQFPTTVQVPGRAAQTIATFRLSGVRDMQLDLVTRRNRLAAAIRAIVHGGMDNDSLNRLLLRADIAWNYVALIRAYQHYARQIQFPHSFLTIEDALLRHADVVRAITELFRAKFDPDIEGLSATTVDEKRTELVERTRRAILSQLEGVADLVSDQVLRLFYELVEATVRTNFFSRRQDADHHIVLKFDPSKITRLPEPRPFREIWVHHPQVAGVHLRGGPVARGGIRWSDRAFDFRTEVLGLMATQNLKNVLIVPRGAKGGFVLRQPPADTAERRAVADELYKTFIGGLLDVTDNLASGQPQTPPRVLRYDGPDHYLVVAADKGTAHLSDTANGIAEKRGFWLGDAFASGGSKGYDHKKEAITARGAWECVKRHFHEVGKNPEVDKLTVAGVGDMSGDVFGNGLLRSRTLQLIAAFDHRNIFIDPNPDPEKSFLARERLFKLPRSSWEDYPKDALSKGAGIYPRGAKAIKLSPEAAAALGITSESLSAPELVRAILAAPVDLLWNGGIGTYIKGQKESHLDVGDPANDAVRIDAAEVRAKVIGEGGNLGITSQGRVELAQKGVRLNTDALDNSAGVDLSDHEVNLKILFQLPVSKGELSLPDRDRLMEDVKPEVCSLVLQNNWVQSRMLSLDVLRSRRDPARFWRAIAFLSERVPFNRRDMNLPGERIIAERRQRQEGLFRPELAVLAANAKLDLRQELVKAQDLGVAELRQELFAYFPKALVERFRTEIEAHPLAINMARTILTNQIMGDAGSTFIAEMALRSGKPTQDILAAYRRATQLLGAAEVKHELDLVETRLEAQRGYQLRLVVEDALEEVSAWILARDGRLPKGFEEALSQALVLMPEVLDPKDTEAMGALSKDLVSLGLSPGVAARLAVLLERTHEIIDVALLSARAHEGGLALETRQVAQAYLKVGEATGLSAMVRAALDSSGSETFDRPARFALRAQLQRLLVDLAMSFLRREADLQKPSAEAQATLDEIKRDVSPLKDGRELCNLVVAADRVERRLLALR